MLRSHDDNPLAATKAFNSTYGQEIPKRFPRLIITLASIRYSEYFELYTGVDRWSHAKRFTAIYADDLTLEYID